MGTERFCDRGGGVIDRRTTWAVFLSILMILSTPVGAGVAGALEPAGDRPTDLNSTTAVESLDETAGTTSDWPTAGHDANRSGHAADAVGPKDSADARWVFEHEENAREVPPVVSDGRVFVTTNQQIRALDNETGEVLWNVSSDALGHSGTFAANDVAVAEGVVVITTGSYHDEIYAFDATDGTELWSESSFNGESLAISNGTVYVEKTTSSSAYVYAFDLQSGTQLWLENYAEDVGGGLAVNGNTVYATGMQDEDWDRDYAIYALNASDGGSEQWRFEVEGEIVAPPTVVNGTVFVGSGDETYDPKFYALNESDGHVEWIHDLNTQAHGAAVADGTVYVSVGNTLRAFDEVTGEEQWNYGLTGSRDHGSSSDPTIAVAPAVADGIVYVANDEGHAVAVNGSTGNAEWAYRVEGEAQPPAIADGRIYVHAPDGRGSNDVVRLYALEEPPFEFSNLDPSAATVAPGEELLVNVTVENVDDEERTYNLSLMGEGVLPDDWQPVARENATLASGATTTVTFTTEIDTTGSWNLSVKRDLEPEASIGPVTVEVVHPEPDDNWQMAGFDTGWTDSNPNATAPARHLQERWNVSWVDGSEFDDLSEPVVEGETAYILHVTEAGSYDYYHLVAHDLESGDVEWEHNLTADHRIPKGSPTVVDGTVYVFTGSSTGYGDGAPDPTVGTVYAFDGATGDVTWSTNTSLNSTSSRLQYDYAPIVANDRVYVGAANRDPDSGLNASLIALHANDGSENWTYRVADENEDEFFQTFGVSGDTVVATLSDEGTEDVEAIVALDARDGSLHWQNDSFDLALDEQIVADDERVYATNRTTDDEGNSIEELYALNVADGSEAWRFQPPNVSTTSSSYDSWILFKPTVTEDAVYLRQRETDSSYAYERLNRINASTGDLEWRRSFSDRGPIKVADGLIYTSGTGSDTYIYDTATGEQLGKHGEGLGNSGAVRTIANGTMFAWDAGEGGGLRAFVEGGVFEYTDLSVSSNRADAGENVTITANVTNTGTLNRSYLVYLRTSPDVTWLDRERAGTLAPGQSETLTWEGSFAERGDYVVVLGPSDDKSMDSHVYDRTDGITVSVGDDRDGQTVPLDGPRTLEVTDGSWPKEGLDAGNTGNHSTTAAPTTVGSDVIQWQVDHPGEWTSAPTIANNTVFVGGDHAGGYELVYAFNATDGAEIWQYQTHGNSELETAPTYANGYLYVADSSGRVYQFDADTGERIWTFDVGDDVGGVSVVDDVAYVTAHGYDSGGVGYFGVTYALNASTREVLWSFEKASTSYGMKVNPAVEDGTVYLTSDDGYTYALNATTGQEEWNQPIAGSGSSLHSPVVEDGVVYVDDSAFSNDNSNIYALDGTTGDTIWSIPADVDGYIGSSPALANDTLYFAETGSVRAIDASDGSARWSTAICAAVDSSPAIADGVVYVTTMGGIVYAFDADNGDLLWRLQAGEEAPFSPAVVDGLLYATSSNDTSDIHSLYALDGGTTNESKEFFSYSGLSVSPTDVSTGETVTVSAYVTNEASASCEYTANLSVNGSVQDTTTGTVAGDSAEQFDFTTSFDSAGTYNVAIENLTAVEVNVTGAEPEVDVSPTSYEFRDVEADNTSDWTSTQFTVSNVGQADLDWTGSDLSGPDEGSFDITTGESGGVLGPSEQQTITVWFAPFDPGTKTATLNVYTNDTDDSTVEVPVSGTAVADPPVVQVTPTTIDFGDVTNGSSVETNVTVENVGGSALSFDGVTLGSSDYDSFAVVDGDTTLSLDPGETHNVTVEFAPTSENVDTATLTVNTDDPENGNVDVSLSGTGVAPEPGRVAVTPMGIDFGDVVNGTSESTNVTLENVGEADLEFKSASVGGSDFGSFSLGGDGTPATLTPGETRNVTVTFAPTSANPDSATLTIGTNDPNNSTVDVSLSGTGVPVPKPDIEVSPTAHYFETVPVDGTADATFNVNNTGDETLDVTGFSVSGANASDFTVQSSPFTVAPEGTQTITVEFAPTSLGTKSATVDVLSNDTDESSVMIELGGGVIDTTPPDVRIVNVTGSNETGSLVYANASVAVEVNATDDHSAIDRVMVGLLSNSAQFEAYANATYDETSGNWTASFDQSDVPDEGAYSVKAAAWDSADNGNQTAASQTVVIDRTSPQLGASLSRIDASTAAVNLSASESLQAGSVMVNVTLPDNSETTVTMDGSGEEWNGTFTISQDGSYEIEATGIDYAGNYGSDEATSSFQTLNTTNKTVTVILEPSGTFIRFNTSVEVNDTYVVVTDSKTPLAPLGNDRAGLNFLRAQLGQDLTANMTNATIGVPVFESSLPRGAGKGDVNLSYFNETTKQWEDLGTEIQTVTVNGTTEDYWVTEVDHFSTYGTVVTDTNAPTLDETSPSGTLAAGTTEATVRFDYSDDISGVNTSAVSLSFDGSTVSGNQLSVTREYASYQATGLSAGTYTASVSVEDEKGNADTFALSFEVAATSAGGSGGSGGSGGGGGGAGSTTETPTPTPEPTPTTTEVPTTVSTPTPTATPASTPTVEQTPASTGTPTVTPEDGQPGFGPVVAFIALLAAGLFALRRRD